LRIKTKTKIHSFVKGALERFLRVKLGQLGREEHTIRALRGFQPVLALAFLPAQLALSPSPVVVADGAAPAENAAVSLPLVNAYGSAAALAPELT
jgi:hypothetical protein